ncbi:uncharacterized protein EDB93DRAFT_1154443 [Suillus bovinus]|uniref:uncharacterized protein n=1 Tax=Suillus bovinus TaxID=48563 RepID=UPI001B8745DB|nr:uncharacterized protein EDB93DRAFT_1154443 [Suillus bovinus]KAG2143747.1 hypothetical protein EDB93DRAFT_1154443 [Suillus bovinus]
MIYEGLVFASSDVSLIPFGFQRDNLIKQHEARIMQLEASLARRIREVPQVGSSRDDKQDEHFWNEPPSGLRDQQDSGTHGATNHLIVKEPRRADRIPLEKLANGDSDNGESEDEKDLATRQVKRTISLDEDESTRPARRPVSTLAVPCRLSTRNLTVKEKFETPGNGEDHIQGPRSIKEDEQATKSVVSRDGLNCFCSWFNEFVWIGPVCADCLSIIIMYQ